MEQKIILEPVSPQKSRNDMLRQGTGYIITAFGLVAGLAWNDAVKSLIEFILPIGNNTIFAKFIYALVITIIVIKITSSLVRITNHEEQK